MKKKDITLTIDGGLGSQILGYMKYLYLKELHFDKVFCDLNYFEDEIQRKRSVERPDLTVWKWVLDYYGVNLKDLPTKNNSLLNNLTDRLWKNPIDPRMNQYAIRCKYNNELPISADSFYDIKSLIKDIDQPYVAIHTRAGDYLKVASLLYTSEQNLKVLSKFKSILPEKIIFLSDDNHSDSFKNKANTLFPKKEIIYLDDKVNEFTAHAIMRKSSVLFATNSTFSITAALLQEKEGIAFMPKYFATKEHSDLNNQFFELSSLLAF